MAARAIWSASRARMLQRFLTQPDAASREDVDYLLDKMDQISHERRAEAQVGAQIA